MFSKKKVEVFSAVLFLLVVGVNFTVVGDSKTTEKVANSTVIAGAEESTEQAASEKLMVATSEEATEVTTVAMASTETEAVTSRSSSSLMVQLNGDITEEEPQLAENTEPEPQNTEPEVTEEPSPVVEEQPVVEETTTEEPTEEESSEEQETSSEDFVWDGPKLTKRGGVLSASQSPSGYRETYYNLPMGGCLRLMGYSADSGYVREDGVKMLNGYVMVASPNLSKYPKGSLIKTSLGMGIVVDYCPGGSLDIAVTW